MRRLFLATLITGLFSTTTGIAKEQEFATESVVPDLGSARESMLLKQGDRDKAEGHVLLAAQVESAGSELDETEAEESEYGTRLFSISGGIELTHYSERADFGNESDSEVEFSLDVTVSPDSRFSFIGTLQKDHDEDLEVDQAYLSFDVWDDESLFLMAGRKFLPFGHYKSEMIEDTLPNQLGESSLDAVLEASYWYGGLNLRGFLFKGKSTKTEGEGRHKQGHGLAIGHLTDTTYVGVNYISNIVESDAFNPRDVAKKIPAISLHGDIELGKFQFVGEYMVATRNFSEDDLDESITTPAKPSALQLEATYHFDEDRLFGLSYNKSREAEEIDLREKVYGVVYRQSIYRNVSGALEYTKFKDYDGDRGYAFVAEISWRF